MKKVLRSFHSQLPVLSDSEKDMKKELQTIHDQLQHLSNAIRQVGNAFPGGKESAPPRSRGSADRTQRCASVQSAAAHYNNF